MIIQSGERKVDIMEKFRVGDCVYIPEDYISGKIVKLQEDTAFVEFKTSGGGGCLQFELSELEHEKWCITTDDITHNGTVYLGWQNPAWDEDGYFWTSKEIVERIIKANNTSEHPFIFNSRRAAIKHLKTLHIPQKCRVIRW